MIGWKEETQILPRIFLQPLVYLGTKKLCMYVLLCACNVYVYEDLHRKSTALPIIFEGQFQVFQRFSSSKLVRKAVESCFVALNYYGNGSKLLLGIVCVLCMCMKCVCAFKHTFEEQASFSGTLLITWKIYE